MILALETSCDDTCAAVVTPAGEVLANVVSSQGVHDAFGGVVPEIASRHHLELVNAVVHALRGDDRRKDLAGARDDRGAGVVAAGLDAEDHGTGAPSGTRHMIRASSPLSA